jgi:hypothetical protein
VDPEQQVWFLECNQDGAWGWLDDIVEGAVTRAFADAFSRRLNALCDDGPTGNYSGGRSNLNLPI